MIEGDADCRPLVAGHVIFVRYVLFALIAGLVNLALARSRCARRAVGTVTGVHRGWDRRGLPGQIHPRQALDLP